MTDTTLNPPAWPANVPEALPPLYSQEHEPDVKILAKYTLPGVLAGPVWYATEGEWEKDGEGGFTGRFLMFGWAEVIHGMGELGYFLLQELNDIGAKLTPLEEPTMMSAVLTGARP